MTNYYWCLSIDHTDEPEPKLYTVHWGSEAAMQRSHCRIFRLYDADDILYYTGTMFGDIDDEEICFAPLDWASGYAGCTRIEYLQQDGSWETM